MADMAEKPKRRGAPKGNQNAVGNSGRPRLWMDPEAFAAKVDEYFEIATVPSIVGISLHLGFCDKDSFSQYANYGFEFSRSVQKARLLIEKDRIERLNDKARFSPGTIFDLKNNYGWVDKQEVTMTVNHEDRLDRVRERLNGRRPEQQLPN
jgi:hypothetical protein